MASVINLWVASAYWALNQEHGAKERETSNKAVFQQLSITPQPYKETHQFVETSGQLLHKTSILCTEAMKWLRKKEALHISNKLAKVYLHED